MKEMNSISYRQLRGFFFPVQKQHTVSFSWKLILDTCNTYTLVLVCILEQELSEFGGLADNTCQQQMCLHSDCHMFELLIFFFFPSPLLCLSDAAFASFLCGV